MEPPFPRRSAGYVLLFCTILAFATELPRPTPIGKPAKEIYRYVMPDGQIVYSDKPIKGGKLDETITVDPPIAGATTNEFRNRPVIPPRNERTRITRVIVIPMHGEPKTLVEADAEVYRAEMLLDDARKRQEAGVEPLPGERTGNAGGGSRLNDIYKARQRRLAEEVAEAEAVLRSAIAERDALR